MILIEAAVTTVDEARAAVAAGADRLELCASLEVGGVTPPQHEFLPIREAVAVPVWVLVRPRPGNFVYSDVEFDTLKNDAEWFLTRGADGIAVGVLNSNGLIDVPRSAALAALAGGRAVFHRAFDELADRFATLEALIGMGYRRVLTSGGAATALDGADGIAALIHAARGRIEILPGGGIGPENALELIRRAGCTQIHGSFRGGKPTLNPDAIRKLRAAVASNA